jgi:asparagine synthase (glutamine-hydrolysing)
MCGITGFVTKTPSSFPEGVIRRMTDVIHHRGPDAEGFYRDTYAALGHRRLSIIDVSAGQQPMFNESGDLCIIFNGEIFNHAQLRPDLEHSGHQYRTKCDTETILHAYEQYGPDCVHKFRGMFAFAIWNSHTRTLFCARDRLGIKPFYYFWDGQLFVFASEIKALLQHPAISARFEETLLPEHLALGYSSDDRTLFAGIRKLMPGHRLTLTPQGLEISKYWDVPQPARDNRRDDASWIAECRSRLEETVRMRLMSDVPLGMFLSGGVDSSAIAALTAKMVTGRLKTFSVGYREAAFSELSYAAQVAKTIGTDHHEVTVGDEDFFGALPRLIWHEDEPIVWPSSVSLFFVSKLAAQQVKVVLTGEGADELFGGYERYRHHLMNARMGGIYSLAPQSVRNAIRKSLADSTLLTASVRRKLQHTVLGRQLGLESLYIDNFYGAFSTDEQAQLLQAPADRQSPYRSVLQHWNASGERSLLNKLLYTDQKTYLVELLMKQDQMSMAASIESRVPFLDHPFVEFASSVPDHLKIHRGAGKYILKSAVEDLLPKDIVYRKKMGFPTPLRAWLRGPRSQKVFTALRTPDGFLAQYVHKPALDTLLDRHASGQIDATDRIWRLLNLQTWGQIFLSGRSDTVPTIYDENPVGQV